ncbi:poly-gamma-glutamate hydrolase family protein [Streptomyces sp. NPDC091027]|uniref:poly-gamma-glutamate hydrolase family protein n=1 Tax=Streptomyces sp. NPDC091027 TaxID=3365971 RepID=UPI003815B784
MADTYASYAQLAAAKTLGVDYLISSRAVVGARGAHIAVHGGAIEPATSQLADYCAEVSGSSYYAFQGMMSGGNSALHITSTRFDEPTVFQVLRAAEWTVSWHGTSGAEQITYIGGVDTELGTAIRERLTSVGFLVAPTTPIEIDGDDPLNIANRNQRGRGVQLELSRGLRESFYANGDLTLASTANPDNRTNAFFAYATAVLTAVAELWPQSRPATTSTTQPVAGPETASSTAGYPGAGNLQMRMPFQLDAMGRVAVLTTLDEMLVQRARGVVATVPGDYVGEPAFGADISDALFRPSDPIAPMIITEKVQSAMRLWEPDSVVTAITPIVQDDQEGIVDVRVDVAQSNSPAVETEHTETVHILPGGRVIGSSL